MLAGLSLLSLSSPLSFPFYPFILFLKSKISSSRQILTNLLLSLSLSVIKKLLRRNLSHLLYRRSTDDPQDPVGVGSFAFGRKFKSQPKKRRLSPFHRFPIPIRFDYTHETPLSSLCKLIWFRGLCLAFLDDSQPWQSSILRPVSFCHVNELKLGHLFTVQILEAGTILGYIVKTGYLTKLHRERERKRKTFDCLGRV